MKHVQKDTTIVRKKPAQRIASFQRSRAILPRHANQNIDQ